VQAVTAGRGRLSSAVTVTGAGSVPGIRRGSGHLAAARSKTAATAAKTTLASGMFGAIRFFMAHLLRYELRSLQSCLACWAGLPGTYDVMNSGCRRRPKWQMSVHRPGMPCGVPDLPARDADRLPAAPSGSIRFTLGHDASAC
jgi:hypothetical protein